MIIDDYVPVDQRGKLVMASTKSKELWAILLEKAWAKGDVVAKWAATSWAKKIAAKKKRASLNDFGRFKMVAAKRKRNAAVKAKVGSA